MKKAIAYILIGCIILGFVSGCSPQDTPASGSKSNTTSSVALVTTASSKQTAATGSSSEAQGQTGDSTGAQRTTNNQVHAPQSGTSESAGNVMSSSATVTKPPVKKTTVPAKVTTTTATKENPPTTKTTNQWEKTATAADAKAVADRVIYYINQYRAAQGSQMAAILPGLTRVAEYRSKQLVSNFAHDTKDERAAFAKYQYGEYIDATLFGDPPENSYYCIPGGEAISQCYGQNCAHRDGGTGCSIDRIASCIATGMKNSAGHWSYVGSSRYPYIAVGVTLSDGTWYCCISVSETNQYG